MAANLAEKEFLELAWAAGFFDGEGNVRCRADNQLVLQIAQVDRRVLDRFCSAVGDGMVRGPYTKKNSNSQPYHNCSLHNERAALAYNLIRPFLSPVKCQQGDEAISDYLRRRNVRSHLAA